MNQRRGLLIILSSPSGAGKSSLAKRLRAWDTAIQFSVSATTRAPRSGETHGRDYYFHSRDEFQALVASDEMLEHAEVFGNLYGSPKAPVSHAIDNGQDVLFDVDWQGGQQLRNSQLANMRCRFLSCHPRFLNWSAACNRVVRTVMKLSTAGWPKAVMKSVTGPNMIMS
jgi:guanylate kinase